MMQKTVKIHSFSEWLLNIVLCRIESFIGEGGKVQIQLDFEKGTFFIF